MEHFFIKTDIITLGQFLKWAGICATGGEAKMLIAEGLFSVNGEVIYQRGKKLKKGDIIKVKNGKSFLIETKDD